MGCTKELCTAEKMFIFVNIAFAMYAGALLATAARLAWDPSTYTWFRFLCSSQYKVSAVYVLAAGLWLVVLVYLAAGIAARRFSAERKKQNTTALHVYSCGVIALAISEIAYGAWMVTSLVTWWRTSPQAELARKGMDLLHDIKPALLAVERYKDVALPLYHMIEEVEREAPNNAFVIIIFGGLGAILQVLAVILSRRLVHQSAQDHSSLEKEKACDEDSDCADEPAPGLRKKANLRMYTILDKIF